MTLLYLSHLFLGKDCGKYVVLQGVNVRTESLFFWDGRIVPRRGKKKKKKVFFAYFLFNAQGRSFLEELSDISFRYNTLGLIFHFG